MSSCPIPPDIFPTESSDVNIYYYGSNRCSDWEINNPPNIYIRVTKISENQTSCFVRNGMLNQLGYPVPVEGDTHELVFSTTRHETGNPTIEILAVNRYKLISVGPSFTRNSFNILITQTYATGGKSYTIYYDLFVRFDTLNPEGLISEYFINFSTFALFNQLNNPNPLLNIEAVGTPDNTEIQSIIVNVNDTNSYAVQGNRLIVTPSTTQVSSTFTLSNPGYKIFGTKLWVSGCTLDAQLKTLENYQCGTGFSGENLYGYGVIKYVIAGLVYREFNLDYLDQNFNSQFLESLASSHFSDYLTLFTDPLYELVGYEQYFV